MTFGPSSSLERIGVSCFVGSGVEEFAVPDGVRELCEGCFLGCKGLRRVTFGPSSSLERIGVVCFAGSRVEGFAILDGVRELCDYCFVVCKSLRRVRFGPSSSLERIGDFCFGGSPLVGFKPPPSVRDVGRSIVPGRPTLFVVTLSGMRLTLKCELTDKVEDLKAKIHAKVGLPPDQQRLIFAGSQLEDGNALLDYKIEPGSVVHLIVR